MLGSITLPFQVLMVPQFPIFKELGRLNTFLPLIAPKFLATTAIFTFIRTWSDFFGPLVYLRLPETWPVSVALKGYLDAQSSSDYGSMCAMSVVSLVPMFLVFVLGQRFLIKGIAATGIK
ncbi:MAG TPA: hypothetical protein VKZ65_14340 [Glycomyces sp.]|nr:hypothetical protein [Glycomyces sp.]